MVICQVPQQKNHGGRGGGGRGVAGGNAGRGGVMTLDSQIQWEQRSEPGKECGEQRLMAESIIAAQHTVLGAHYIET